MKDEGIDLVGILAGIAILVVVGILRTYYLMWSAVIISVAVIVFYSLGVSIWSEWGDTLFRLPLP